MSVEHHLFRNPPERGPTFTLLSYARYRCENDWPSIEHSHSFCELLVALDGHGAVVGGGRQTPIRRGSVVLIDPDIMHTEISAADQPLEYAVFALGGIRFGHETSLVFAPDETGERMASAVQSLATELAERRPYFEEVCRCRITDALIELMRAHCLGGCETTDEGDRGRLPSLVKAYLDRYYAADITLETLADAFYVNKFYLAHAFKQATGSSPMQYLCRVRVEAAARLLKTTDFSVTAAAVQTGFCDPSHFCKVFKRVTGITPRQARKAAFQKNADV